MYFFYSHNIFSMENNRIIFNKFIGEASGGQIFISVQDKYGARYATCQAGTRNLNSKVQFPAKVVFFHKLEAKTNQTNYN